MIADAPMSVDQGGYPGATPWGLPAARSEMLAWVDAKLEEHGLVPADEPAVRLRPWSIVIRIPTRSGSTVWVKANPPGSAFEPALTRALDAWAPGFVLTPLAVEPGRGWSLLPDGGRLLARPDPDDPPGRFRLASTRRYTDLQRLLVERVPELLGLGVPDLRPTVMVDTLDELLDLVPVPVVAAARARIVDEVAQLAASPLPASLDHGDLHDRQVFGRPDGRHRFFDWGDASISHPFLSLRVTVGIAVENYGAESPAIGELVDAFLTGWPGDPAVLWETARIAFRLAGLARARSWQRTFPNEGRHDATSFIRAGLTRLLDDPPF